MDVQWPSLKVDNWIVSLLNISILMTMHSEVVHYQWVWHNMTNEFIYYKYQRLVVHLIIMHPDKNNFFHANTHPKYQMR